MDFSRIATRIAAGTFAGNLNAVGARPEWSKKAVVWVKSDPFVIQNVVDTWMDPNPAGLEAAGYNVFAQSKAGEVAFYDHVNSEWHDVP